MSFETELGSYIDHLADQLRRTRNRQSAIAAVWGERNSLLGQYTPAGDAKLAALWAAENNVIKEVLGDANATKNF